jgi:hypothetical protein
MMAVTPSVYFEVIDSPVLDAIEKFCIDNPSNKLIRIGAYDAVWSHPVRDGKGTAKGNGVSDFERVVANAVFNFAVSSVQARRPGGWEWNFRESVRQLVHVVKSSEAE